LERTTFWKHEPEVEVEKVEVYGKVDWCEDGKGENLLYIIMGAVICGPGYTRGL
jgi:hypothetical protein